MVSAAERPRRSADPELARREHRRNFRFVFDGSDVDLTASGENVDAAAVDASGAIYLSTLDLFAVTGVSGADEGVFVVAPQLTRPLTSGTYSPGLLVDGSAFGLTANDVFAIDLP